MPEEVVVTPPVAGPSVADLQAEVDKWKNMSRVNEQRWNDASAERDKLKQGQMTDSEKQLDAARNEARTAAYVEVSGKLAAAELKAQAASAGVTLPGAEFLNMQQFVAADGSVNESQVTSFIASLPKPVQTPAYTQNIGLGRQGAAGSDQLTHEALSNMSSQQINEARKAGKLDLLMRGQI